MLNKTWLARRANQFVLNLSPPILAALFVVLFCFCMNGIMEDPLLLFAFIPSMPRRRNASHAPQPAATAVDRPAQGMSSRNPNPSETIGDSGGDPANPAGEDPPDNP